MEMSLSLKSEHENRDLLGGTLEGIPSARSLFGRFCHSFSPNPREAPVGSPSTSDTYQKIV
jgi:hypothetical protein